MQLTSRYNKLTGCYGPAYTPVSSTVYRVENGNLGNFEAVENNGTAFAPKQCLHQKVAVGMENAKIQSPSRCNKRTGRYGPEIHRVSSTLNRAENGNLRNFEAVENNGTALTPKQCLYRN